MKSFLAGTLGKPTFTIRFGVRPVSYGSAAVSVADVPAITYARVDQLLYLLIDQRYSPAEAVAAGFDQAFVDRVLLRVRQNQFKRMLPVIAKLSNRTIGYDFLYGRDWGT